MIKKKLHEHVIVRSLVNTKIVDFRRFLLQKNALFSNQHNFATIGSILEILDVLSSPDHVLSNFGTFV